LELSVKSTEIKRSLLSKKAVLPTALALAIGGPLVGCGKESSAQNTKTPTELTPAKTQQGTPNPSRDVQGSKGYDVSYPNQTNLPKPASFAIVGLNGINAATFNPYFKRQLAWAKQSTGGSDQPRAAVYVHTANPGPTVDDWPTSGKNAVGTCDGSNSLACAYEYGEDLAKKDMAHENSTGPIVHTVWLDVEGTEDGYSWQPNTTSNATVLEGMVDGFESQDNTVGVYSGISDYKDTIGTTPNNSNLNGLDDWVLGATTEQAAKANCHVEGFTGQVVIAQIAGATLDKNITC
jgi:hypothetical protein